MPYPNDLAAQQLVALPRPSFNALRSALMRDAGTGYATYLQEAGYAGGETAFAAFRDWLAGRGGDAPEALAVDALASQASLFFADAGWGHLEVTPVHDVAAAIDTTDWAEAEPSAHLDHPGCHYTTGLLADFFGRVAASPLAVLEVECRSSGADRCRFIASSADVTHHVYARLTSGTDYLSALNELA